MKYKDEKRRSLRSKRTDWSSGVGASTFDVETRSGTRLRAWSRVLVHRRVTAPDPGSLLDDRTPESGCLADRAAGAITMRLPVMSLIVLSLLAMVLVDQHADL